MRQTIIKKSLAAILLIFGGVQAVSAETPYPTRAITVVVAYAPGGTADSVTRIVTGAMSQELGVPVIVENKPGGSGALGVSSAARAAADGYTILSASSELSLASTGKTALSPDTVAKFEPLVRVATSPIVLVADSKKENTLLGWKRAAKEDADSITYATPGVMTPMHLMMTQLTKQADIPIYHVPYNGGSRALVDLLGGQVDLLAVALGTVLPQIKSNQTTPLAVLYPERSILLPDAPTIDEALGETMEAMPAAWFGWFIAKDTDPTIKEKLITSLEKVLVNKQVQEQMLNAGLEPALLGASEFNAELEQEKKYYIDAVGLIDL